MSEHLPPAAFLHDRWEDQLALEQEMLAVGTQRVRDQIEKARKKRDMSNLRPYRNLLHDWVLPVAEGVREWIRKGSSAKRGPKPKALPRLQELDPDTAGLVALKSILRMLSIEQRHVLAVAEEIGTWCEHEARCKKWSEEDPEDWKTNVRHYEQRGSNAAHQRRSRISMFTKHVWERIGWIPWTKPDRQRVGLELINIVIETTRRFRIAPDPEWEPKKLAGGAYQQRPYIIQPDAELADYLMAAMDDELVHRPAYWPTLIPPLDWTGPRDGGYYTPFVKTPFLIRFKAHHEDMHQRALDEYESLDMPLVYAAINHVQQAPWKINERVLAVANAVWDKDLAIAGLPRREPITVPSRPEHLTEKDRDTEEYRAWARAASEAHAENAKKVSRVIAYRRAFTVANRMAHEPAIYFPHMLDFRGRMYPIPADLSPQGEDLHRGLLMSAILKPVSEEASVWLAIHLANTFGVDKVSFGERIAWVAQRKALWLGIARDPMEQREWMDADDPWQALAAAFEWARWLTEGEGMLSGLPIRVDGTCNGIQHLSAMVRDEHGAASVNLIPSERPRDIYQEVADILTDKLHQQMPNELANLWLHVFKGRAPRSVTKRPVMILPYGGTRSAYSKYTREWLKKHDPHGVSIPKDRRKDAVSFLVPIMWEAVSDTVVRAREVMEWLQKCALEAAKEGMPLRWITPSGFVVRQFYGAIESTRVKTLLDGQRIDLRAEEYTSVLDRQEQMKGIAPNFVHSMDASALMSCINLLKGEGVTFVTAIHDAYGTVCADMALLAECLREAFVLTYEEDVLEDFRENCRAVAGPRSELPALLKCGELELSEILISQYFFA